MKILLIGWFYLIYPVISAKEMFEILGYEVVFFPLLHYNIKFTKNPDALYNIFMKFIHDFKIDIVLWWNWECDEFVMKKIKENTPSILHCLFNWDHPFCLTEWDKTKNRQILKKNIWDIIFVTSNDQFDEYIQTGTKFVHYLPMFADSQVHYPLKDENYTCDVSFVLTNLYENKEMFPETYIDRKKMIQDIINAGISIQLYGPEHLKKIFPKQYKGPIHFTENHKVFYNSKVNICTHGAKGFLYCNERVATILHSGGLLFVDKVDGIENILTDKHDCVFIDPNNYIEQIKDILSNYNNYKGIKENAVITANKKFNVETWAKKIDMEIKNYFNFQSTKIFSSEIVPIPKKVSIIMTYYNRIEQILHTLQTIEESNYPKNLIEVICYDDRSEIEPLIIDVSKFSYCIKLIYGKLDRDETIINPTYSYNQAFQHVSGEYVILQNSECMHIGDIISKAVKYLEKDDNSLISFPCYATANEEKSKEMFENRRDQKKITQIVTTAWKELIDYPKEFKGWYNERYLRPQGLHFCNAFHWNVLKKVGIFDTRFLHLLGFDDNEYSERFMFCHNINIIIPEHENYTEFTVHQYHGKYNKPRPMELFQKSYYKYRMINISDINKNRKQKSNVDQDKIIIKKYSQIENEDLFLDNIKNTWSSSLVFLQNNIENPNISFLRKCLQNCNFKILENK